MRGSPQEPVPNKKGMHIPVRVNFDPPGDDKPIPTEPMRKESETRRMKRMRITDVMLRECGYTENCPGCTCRTANVGEVRAHTEECRKRIEEAFEGYEEGREIKRRNFERESRRMAEHMEEADQDRRIGE